jgi:hypothetical protein
MFGDGQVNASRYPTTPPHFSSLQRWLVIYHVEAKIWRMGDLVAFPHGKKEEMHLAHSSPRSSPRGELKHLASFILPLRSEARRHVSTGMTPTLPKDERSD